MSEEIVTQSIEFIERLTEPDKMSKADALATLEEIVERLKANCEALREEIGAGD